ncbi:MAG: hypothetical protein RL748_1873 [Pseudomonadota bacterium]|jgi:hypothetical protein
MYNATQTIDHATLSHLAASGEVQGARIIGQSGGWHILIQSGNLARTLAAKRGAMRQFSRFETLVAYLKNLGILTFEVDASQYQPNTTQHSRPDAAQRMQRAHEAAEHDQWFRSEVEAALAEADAPDAEWVEHSVVKEEMAQQRAQLLAMIAGKAA